MAESSVPDPTVVGRPAFDGILVANSAIRLPIILVGLPNNGKSFIGLKLANYLNWLNFRAKVYSIQHIRRDMYHVNDIQACFFDMNDEKALAQRKQFEAEATSLMIADFESGEINVGILDGTNLNQSRRVLIYNRLKAIPGMEEPLFISVQCHPELAKTIFHTTKMTEAEFSNEKLSEDQLRTRYNERIAFLQKEIDPIPMSWSFIEIDRQVTGPTIRMKNARGFLQTKIVCYLMNLHPVPKTVYVSRHGQSLFNLESRIGGDPDLSIDGKHYATRLSQTVERMPDLRADKLHVWTSTLRRTQQTAQFVKCRTSVAWKALDEIDAGTCDGKTYDDVQKGDPAIFQAREQDKLAFRYPEGESYLDVIARLEPVVLEMERMSEPLLIVSHQAVLRCLAAYFTNLDRYQIPHAKIPLHTLMKYRSVSEKTTPEMISIGPEVTAQG